MMRIRGNVPAPFDCFSLSRGKYNPVCRLRFVLLLIKDKNFAAEDGLLEIFIIKCYNKTIKLERKELVEFG